MCKDRFFGSAGFYERRYRSLRMNNFRGILSSKKLCSSFFFRMKVEHFGGCLLIRGDGKTRFVWVWWFERA
jgi:hypothetical protein